MRPVLAQCPYCSNYTARVVSTRLSTDGRKVRRRNCLVCDARWYTVQEPEVHVPDEKIRYVGKYIKHRNLKEKIKIIDEEIS